GLKIDAVVVEADDALDGTGEHLVLRVDAGLLVQELDIETLVAEIAERLGKLRREVDLLLVAADHDLDPVDGARTARRNDRRGTAGGRGAGKGREKCALGQHRASPWFPGGPVVTSHGGSGRAGLVITVPSFQPAFKACRRRAAISAGQGLAIAPA